MLGRRDGIVDGRLLGASLGRIEGWLLVLVEGVRVGNLEGGSLG